MTKIKNIPSSKITPEHIYNDRRNFIKNFGLILSTTALSTFTSKTFAALNALPSYTQSKDTDKDRLSSFKDITTYNNYYEFGTSKSDPHEYATKLKVDPWSITIEGAVNKSLTTDIDELVRQIPLEERIYRLRCVEGWSMVIPWVGIPLNSLLKKVSLTGNAKFVEFVSLKRPSEMIGQKDDMLDWPYTEGLRLDEAMHPLTILGACSPLPGHRGSFPKVSTRCVFWVSRHPATRRALPSTTASAACWPTPSTVRSRCTRASAA